MIPIPKSDRRYVPLRKYAVRNTPSATVGLSAWVNILLVLSAISGPIALAGFVLYHYLIRTTTLATATLNGLSDGTAIVDYRADRMPITNSGISCFRTKAGVRISIIDRRVVGNEWRYHITMPDDSDGWVSHYYLDNVVMTSRE